MIDKARTNPNMRPRRRTRTRRHWVKVGILLLLTAVLTWYGRQTRNNPFAPYRRVHLQRVGCWMLIRCYEANKATNDIVIALPVSACTSAVQAAVPALADKKWILVTIAGLAEPHLSPPPSRRVIVGKVTPLSDSGVTPTPVSSFVEDERIAIHEVTPFGDSLAAVDITFGEMSLLALACSTGCIVPRTHTPFKEAFDIVVGAGLDHRQALRLNDLLRPGRLVYAPPPRSSTAPDSLHPNLRVLMPGGAPLWLRKDSRERIRDIEPRQ
jgi:hypothetical protein